MRKTILFAFALALIFASCANAPQNLEAWAKKIIIWDETMAKEECTGLFITKYLEISSYNGIPVNWPHSTAVYLPPGKIELTLNGFYAIANTRVTLRDVPFEWTFNKGEGYYLYGWISDGEYSIIVVNKDDRKSNITDHPQYKLPRREGPIILN